MLKDLLARLTSRKFLLALGSFITFVALGQVPAAMAVVLGYLGVEGGSDLVTKMRQQ